MTARSTLAAVALEHRPLESPARCTCGANWLPSHVADMAIAAVRAMPVEDQAELISGVVDNGTGYFAPRIRRAIGPWVKSW
jgi:hypothetical protein